MTDAQHIVVSRPINGEEWSERSNYWLNKSTPKSGRILDRSVAHRPLILTGHGVRLSVEKGTLLIRDGFTHYPQQQQIWRFFPGGWRLPSRIVVIDVDGGLSFAALAWLSDHQIPLIQINWRGEVINIVSANPEMTIPEQLRFQLAAKNKNGGLNIALKLIREKIANSIATLRHSFPRSVNLDQAIEQLESDNKQLWHNPPKTVAGLSGVEGKAAQIYFNAWRTAPIKWKGIDKYPIPDDWHQIGRRMSKYETIRGSNRNATHPVNAMLNYAYAVLESRIRTHVSAAGLDPTIGVLHGQYRGKLGLVYDLMEPMRPVVDRQVLEFAQSRTFHPADFTIRNDGVCRLNPELARTVVQILARAKNVPD